MSEKKKKFAQRDHLKKNSCTSSERKKKNKFVQAENSPTPLPPPALPITFLMVRPLDSPPLHQGVPDKVSALTSGLFVYPFLPCLFCLFQFVCFCVFLFFFSPQKFNQNASFKATSQFLVYRALLPIQC